MSKKRPREAPAVDTQLVEIYEDLANVNEDIRLKAAQKLLIKASPASGLAADQLKEILRRLVRGLCSGRKGARLGFSIALTELQSQIFGANARSSFPISIADFVNSLRIETEAGGSVSGQVGANPKSDQFSLKTPTN
jgi:DNA polymerase phi